MKEYTLPDLIKHHIVFSMEDTSYHAWLCVNYGKSLEVYRNTQIFLHFKEYDYYQTLRYEKRVLSYLAGRYAAKHAVSALLGEESLERIYIKRGLFHYPIVQHEYRSNIQVSISHCEQIGAALAFDEETPMGLDVERVHVDKRVVIAGLMTGDELKMVRSMCLPEEVVLTMLWTCKEALSKVIRTGLTIAPEMLEISYCSVKESYNHCEYRHFTSFCAASFIVGNYVYSIAYPKRLGLQNSDATVIRKSLMLFHEKEEEFHEFTKNSTSITSRRD
ncbi:4'-phosphopantetheinyl transferase family protein [Bacillus paralicheniformis]|uniref:4'-phosphopantetheinyl transferase family protein n=1 Tax=Bacillus paralicheniformis TaxID=1648923 RepID=UPI001319F606|nr:4'-phosphopantetheinyl transferase superfamily protein [Bacillus paralicheniformis]